MTEEASQPETKTTSQFLPLLVLAFLVPIGIIADRPNSVAMPVDWINSRINDRIEGTVEYQLACKNVRRDHIATTDISISEFRKLLDLIGAKSGHNDDVIAVMTCKAYDSAVSAAGDSMSLLRFMDESWRTYEMDRSLGLKYEELLGLVVTLIEKNALEEKEKQRKAVMALAERDAAYLRSKVSLSPSELSQLKDAMSRPPVEPAHQGKVETTKQEETLTSLEPALSNTETKVDLMSGRIKPVPVIRDAAGAMYQNPYAQDE